jgi:hypothetical protein
MSKSIPTSVPHKIKGAFIVEMGWRNPSTNRVKVLTHARPKHAGVGIGCEMAVFSEGGALLCHIKWLNMTPVMSLEVCTDSARTLVHLIDWKPHILLRTHEQPHGLLTAEQSKENEDAIIHDQVELEGILRSIAQQNIDSLRGTDLEKVPAHMKYISWIERQLREKPNEDVPEACDLARRGALTSYTLSVFQSIEARTGGIAFSEYIFSDASIFASIVVQRIFVGYRLTL